VAHPRPTVALDAHVSDNAATYAPPTVRDDFLAAIARGDSVMLAQLATNLTGCGNPLPSTTCVELGVPVGSTYGVAARRIVDQAAER